jgi:rSAM/selenodomain-associated transferase 1
MQYFFSETRKPSETTGEHMTNAPLILLFIKAPVRGQVKTRIAAALGEDAALELYQRFVLDILDALEQTGVPVRICYSPPDSGKAVTGWLGPERQYQPQEGRDVGERMADAFQQAFSGGISRAVLIGSDIPDLPAPLLKDVMAALLTHDAVIGPACDGGYYLIGFKDETFLPSAFQHIPWSTSAVFERTMAAFDRAGKQVHVLPEWQDVDTIQDLKDLSARGRMSAFRSSRTMSYLAGIEQTCLSSEDSDAKIRL